MKGKKVIWSAENLEEIKNLYLDGCKLKDIGKKFNVGSILIQRTLRRIKVYKYKEPIKLNLSNENKAYIAGAIDGEGNIQISRRTTTLKGATTALYVCYIKISNTDRRMLDYIKNAVGDGTISCDYRENSVRRNCYHLRFSQETAKTLLKEIYDYLVIKKEQADVIFSIRDTYSKTKYFKVPDTIAISRKEYWEKLKLLHHKRF